MQGSEIEEWSKEEAIRGAIKNGYGFAIKAAREQGRREIANAAQLEAYEIGKADGKFLENEACAKVIVNSELFCKDEMKLKRQLVEAIRSRMEKDNGNG